MYSVGIAYLLWVLSGFGALGFHRFYLGKIPTGILWMCTGGLGMFGAVYDFFTLPSQVNEANLRRAVFHGSVRDYSGYRQPQWRNVNDGEAHIVHEKESIERTLLKAAKEHNGVITPGELALAAGTSIEEAKKVLDAMVSKGFAELRVRRSGALVYTIPDLMTSDEPFEDF
ncbi:MAG: TM2 domain-containing protein [Treponema sp.]|jgi:hypothetical protein|nr:TM2 domain-containing protein [Treponema sp.]